MDMSQGLSRDFKNKVIKHFKSSRRAVWGKNQIVYEIKDLWIEWLEESMIDIKFYQDNRTQ